MIVFIGLFLSFFIQAQSSGMFKDLRTYYEQCGLVGKNDSRFAACNPPNINQMMEGFKKDPKNNRDMEKIARFHMTHSLQQEAKESLKKAFKELKEKQRSLKEMAVAWKSNQHFILAFSSKCGRETSLDYGQELKRSSPRKKKVILETFEHLKKYSCENESKKFQLFAIGVVDPTERPDVWMINEKGELQHILRSTGKTPFED